MWEPRAATAPHMNPWDAVDAQAGAVCVDCEMVQCEGKLSALARVCLVSVHSEEVLLDAYCAPPSRVVDYLTRYSGIRERDLLHAKPFAEVQQVVRQVIDGRPLVGHGIVNDLRALQLDHPPFLVVDTLDLEWGAGQRKGLKHLSVELLGQPIQRGGHSPVEDCLATVRLLKLHRAHRGPPPPRIVSVRLQSAGRPEPPGGFTVRRSADETHDGAAAGSDVDGDEGGEDTAGGVNGRGEDPTCGAEELQEWVIDLEWSADVLADLLAWWCDEGSNAAEASIATLASPSERQAGLRFPPSLPKEHRALLHRAAKHAGLATVSRGLGPERSIRVLPVGVLAPEPSARTKRLAALVFQWSKRAAEQDGDEAMEPPYSVGEIEELVDALSVREAEPRMDNESIGAISATASCVDVAALIARATAVLPTTPSPSDGQEHARRSSRSYIRMVALQGVALVDDDGGRRGDKGGGDWRRRHKRK
jgi:DNA polymerase III epsilon subunit-like protein